jgi:hypothetical protein
VGIVVEEDVDVRGSETWPVTSFEGAMGVLLYGIFALCVRAVVEV